LYADRLELSGGLMYATFAGSVFAVRLVAGNLADRVGRMAVALPGLVAAAAGLALLAAATPGPAGLAYLGTAGFGLGHGLLFPALMAWVVDLAPPAERGGALGSFTAFGDLGQGGGGWVVGRIVDTAGFPAAYLSTAALCVMGMGVLAVLRLRPPVPARLG
jgi:MFS family permease